MPQAAELTPSSQTSATVGVQSGAVQQVNSTRLWLLAMVALTLITRLPFLGHPAADFDEQLYSLIGQSMLDGAVPYVDLWDRKPPGLFLLYAAFHALGGPTPCAYQIPAMLACLAGAWLTYRIACRIAPSTVAAAAAALYPPLMALFGSHSGQSEVFYVPLMLTMALLLLQSSERSDRSGAVILAALAMLVGGLALQVKYTVFPVCLLFGGLAIAILHTKGLRRPALVGSALLFAVLGILPTALAAAWYARAGYWDAFVFANFLSARLRLTMPLGVTLGKQMLYAAPLGLFVFAGLIQAARMRSAGMALPRAYWAGVSWLCCAIAGLFMGTTVYVYYYAALIPPILLIATPMFGPIARHGTWIAIGIAVWLTAALNPIASANDARQEQANLASLTDAIRPHINPPRRDLFIYDGPVVLYRLTGSVPPTRFAYPDHLNNALEAPALPIDPQTEVARILAAAPAVIVTSPKPVTMRNKATEAAVNAALARSYVLVKQTEFQNRPIQVYVRLAR